MADILKPIGISNPSLSTISDRINKNGMRRTLKAINDIMIPLPLNMLMGKSTSPAKMQALIVMSDHVNSPVMATSTIIQVTIPRKSNPKKMAVLSSLMPHIFNDFP